MAVNATATEPRPELGEPIAFRPTQTQREILDAFRKADGDETMTPLMREMVGFYIAERVRRGREAVRVDPR